MRTIKTLVTVLALGLGMVAPALADGKTDADELVQEAVFTVERMRSHERHGEKVEHYMKRAKAVFIVPEMLKGAFLIGGEGGSGVLLARADNGQWSYPAFYNIGSGSFGLQVGAQSSEVMLIVMTGKGLSAILDRKVTLGGDISAAAGPIGEGMEASTTTNLDADVLAYSTAKGAFIGASVEGAVIWPSEDDNQAYYGAGAKPKDIILNGKYRNGSSDSLRELLASFKKN
ncbi:lipid-binding SYLF domain-containing protein [Aestuariispira insulae]|uniref:Lipid-binding SYLF domain-containing protein n=1 Tax=Aestuariispira insulae TaxID=1461337 RepID=A0A3D9HP16_9PROT|nr:lipid-binding SYLF domain-containing protein [Aestuariispira insulae]RED51222.1 lipid-binding SYLF domain-containing protein [Aestuariispira insulae]